MSRIIICRHGNTFDKGDVVTRVGARTDLPLSVSGRRQAEALKMHFLPETSGYHFTRAYCSVLRRTRQTAEVVLSGGHDARLETRDFLIEVDYGPDENQPEADVMARIGEEALRAWDETATVPPGWSIDPAAIVRGWQDFLIEQAGHDEDVLVVTSNGTARFLFQVAEPLPETVSIKLKTGAYGLIETANSAPLMKSWNIRP